MKTLKNLSITYQLAVKDGNRSYFYDGLVSDLGDSSLVAKVKTLVDDTGKIIIQDQFVKDEDWMTIEEYYNSL